MPRRLLEQDEHLALAIATDARQSPGSAATQLVPLHCDFDWLQSRQVGWIDQYLDAASDTFLACDESVAFERKQHLVN